MNYEHVGTNTQERVVKRGSSAAQQKKMADAHRIEELNRLTRYPSLLAVIASGIALLSAVVHVIH